MFTLDSRTAWIDGTEAARIIGVSRRNIPQLVHAGALHPRPLPVRRRFARVECENLATPPAPRTATPAEGGK
jgi:hypothetical protein